MAGYLRRKIRNMGAHEVRGHEVTEELEPEGGEKVQHLSFVWNAGLKNVVEGADAILVETINTSSPRS